LTFVPGIVFGFMGLWCLTPFSTIFQLYRESTRGKQPTCRK